MNDFDGVLPVLAGTIRNPTLPPGPSPEGRTA
jgi:hypothetical protein